MKWHHLFFLDLILKKGKCHNVILSIATGYVKQDFFIKKKKKGQTNKPNPKLPADKLQVINKGQSLSMSFFITQCDCKF